MHAAPSINLAKKRGSIFDKFITWSLTIGRLVIIITEAIAMSAFLYRFTLDAQLSDIHDNIAKAQTIVNNFNFKEQEAKYRNLQQRLSSIKSYSTNTTTLVGNTTKVFHDILGLVPPSIKITDLLYSIDNVKINADTQSASSLASFTQQIKSYPSVRNVSIDSISNKTSTGTISVAITIALKN